MYIKKAINTYFTKERIEKYINRGYIWCDCITKLPITDKMDDYICDNFNFILHNQASKIHHDIIFSKNESLEGIKYMKDNNLIENCINFNFSELNNTFKMIDLLNFDFSSDDLKVKNDLSEIIESSNMFKLSKYLYNIIYYIK